VFFAFFVVNPSGCTFCCSRPLQIPQTACHALETKTFKIEAKVGHRPRLRPAQTRPRCHLRPRLKLKTENLKLKVANTFASEWAEHKRAERALENK
jgi:hypothetical protein